MVFLILVWSILFMSIAVTWSLLNLPETESIQISRQPSITFDKQGRIIASLWRYLWSNYSIQKFTRKFN